MRQLVLLIAALPACAPPPEVGASSEPTITIAFPEIDGGVVGLECLPNPEFVCGTSDPEQVAPYAEQLDLTVVVDIDNLELVDPYAPDTELIEGQGHWHAHINNESITSSSTRVANVLTEVDSGVTVILDVTIRDNEHTLLGPRDTIEFDASPAGVDCSTLPEDYCP